MAFKPVVKKRTVEDEGEKIDIFIRQPSGREMLNISQTFKKENPPEENAKELFSKFVVNEDGSKLSAEQVSEMMDWRFSAMNQASDIVQDEIGLTKLVKAKEGKS